MDVLAVNRPSPRVAAFLTDQKRQYFVITENKVLCEVPSLQGALFYAFASYFVFNLAHPNECEKLLFFFSRLCCPASRFCWVYKFIPCHCI